MCDESTARTNSIKRLTDCKMRQDTQVLSVTSTIRFYASRIHPYRRLVIVRVHDLYELVSYGSHVILVSTNYTCLWRD